jgi:short-subunit dehydrogenase
MAHQIRAFKHVLITGASSGIGEALALSYAAPGVILSLSGRDGARLAAVADACLKHGAAVDAAVCDVADRAAMSAWVLSRDKVRPLDLVVANAGISAGVGESDETTRRIFAINLDGVINTVLPALEVMRPRKAGQIALISSLASFRGVGGAPAYCSSKAAVRVWGEGLRGALAGENIGVSVVCPGFVVSRMTDVNTFPMPFLMNAEKAVRIIQRGLAANKGRIAFPGPMLFGVWLLAALPDAIAGALTRILPKKP